MTQNLRGEAKISTIETHGTVSLSVVTFLCVPIHAYIYKHPRIPTIYNGKAWLSQYKQAGISWGSVHTETVRLQRQIEPALIDIDLKFTEF